VPANIYKPQTIPYLGTDHFCQLSHLDPQTLSKPFLAMASNGNSLHECPYCPRVFPTARSLGGHISWHMSQRRRGLEAEPHPPAAAPALVHLPPAAPAQVHLPAAPPSVVHLPPAPPAVGHLPPAPPALGHLPPAPPALPAAVAAPAGDWVPRLAPNPAFWEEYRRGGSPPAEIDFLAQMEAAAPQPVVADGDMPESSANAGQPPVDGAGEEVP
jgi:hypothetical protein